MKLYLFILLFWSSNACCKHIYGKIYNISSQQYESFFPLYFYENEHFFQASTSNAFGEFYFESEKNIDWFISNNSLKKIIQIRFKSGDTDTFEIDIENQNHNFYQYILSKQFNAEKNVKTNMYSTIDGYGLYYNIEEKKIQRNALPTSIFKHSNLVFYNKENILNEHELEKLNNKILDFKNENSTKIVDYKLIQSSINNVKYFCLKYDFKTFEKTRKNDNVRILLDASRSMQLENNANNLLKFWEEKPLQHFEKPIVKNSQEIDIKDISAFFNQRLMIISDEDFLLKNSGEKIIAIIKKNNIKLELHLITKSFAYTNDFIEKLKSKGINVEFHEDIFSVKSKIFDFYNIKNKVIFSDFSSQINWNNDIVKSFKIEGFNNITDYKNAQNHYSFSIKNHDSFFFVYTIECLNNSSNIGTIQHQFIQHQPNINVPKHIVIN